MECRTLPDRNPGTDSKVGPTPILAGFSGYRRELLLRGTHLHGQPPLQDIQKNKEKSRYPTESKVSWEPDQFIYSPHTISYSSYYLHWEKQVVDQKFHENLISSCIPLTLSHTLLTIFIGRNKLLIKSFMRTWSVHTVYSPHTISHSSYYLHWEKQVVNQVSWEPDQLLLTKLGVLVDGSRIHQPDLVAFVGQ